jgi:protein-arginine kinase activator protein McsA
MSVSFGTCVKCQKRRATYCFVSNQYGARTAVCVWCDSEPAYHEALTRQEKGCGDGEGTGKDPE